MLLLPVVLLSSALKPMAVLELPVVLFKSASLPMALLELPEGLLKNEASIHGISGVGSFCRSSIRGEDDVHGQQQRSKVVLLFGQGGKFVCKMSAQTHEKCCCEKERLNLAFDLHSFFWRRSAQSWRI